MQLLMKIFAVIAVTSSAAVMFFIRQKKIMYILSRIERKKEKEEDSQNNLKQNCFKISELANPNWVQVGRIQNLYMYPLNFGVRKSCSTFQITPHGIIAERNGMMLWDRTFHIYNEQAKHFTTGLTDSMIICFDVMDKFKVRFSATGMTNDLTLDLNKPISRKTWKELKTNWIVIKYIDCGDKAAEWINTFLRTSSMRLIHADYEIIGEPQLNASRGGMFSTDKKAWELLMILTRYTVITSESLKNLEMKIPSEHLKYQPNIVISNLIKSSKPVPAEKDWEWIKIGNIILRKITPVSSLKTNENINCDQPLFMGNFYGVYFTGDMRIYDDVFVHVK